MAFCIGTSSEIALSQSGTTVEDAKALAIEQGTSVSAMFERVLTLMAENHRKRPRVGAIARRATGMLSLPKGTDIRNVLAEALLERHGLKK